MSIFNYLRLAFHAISFLQVSPSNSLYGILPTPHPHTNHVSCHLILLDLITRITFGDDSKSENFSLSTYSTKQRLSWEANWFETCQEIHRISRNLKIHYRIQKNPLPVPILSSFYYEINLITKYVTFKVLSSVKLFNLTNIERRFETTGSFIPL